MKSFYFLILIFLDWSTEMIVKKLGNLLLIKLKLFKLIALLAYFLFLSRPLVVLFSFVTIYFQMHLK